MKWLKRLIAVIIGLAVGLIILEMCLRMSSLDLQREAYAGFHDATKLLPIYTKVFRPSQCIDLPNEPLVCGPADSEDATPIRFRTGPEGDVLPFTNSGSVVVFAGGSTTECFDVQEDLRFPSLTGAILRGHYGASVSTRNWGVRGHTTQDTLTLLIYRLRYIRPKLLVVMHNINDRSWLTHHDQYEASEWTSLSQLEEWIHSLKRCSALAYYALQWAQSREIISSRFPGDHRTRIGTTFELQLKHEAQFAQNLRLIETCAATLGIRVVFMTQALRDFDAGQSRYNQIIRDVCTASKTPLIDLATAFDGQSADAFFEDGVHLSACGSRYAAELIAPQLYQLLMDELPNRVDPLRD